MHDLLRLMHRLTIRTLASVVLSSALLSIASYAQKPRTVKTTLVDHDELFVFEDTIRLDPSVIIGTVRDLDVNSEGELLITDSNARNVYRFSATGRLLYELIVEECHPGAEADFHPFSARFIGDGRMITWANSGRAFLFDDTGHCIEYAKSADFIAIGVCARKDSIFTLPAPAPVRMTMKVLGSNLDLLEEIAIEPMRWPNMTKVLARPGRQLGCFDDDVWYIHNYSPDAIPLRRQETMIQYQHPYFKERTRDLPSPSPRDFKGFNDASWVYALHTLDNSTHLVVHHTLRRLGQLVGKSGYTIVDHKNRFASVSTLATRRHLVGSGGGMLYYKGDHELLSDGELGNPVILRYRFIPPQNKDG